MADPTKIISILDSVLGSHKPQGGAEYLWHCPFCSHHKPKLAVNIQSGNWHCWVCKTGGKSLFSLLKKNKASKHLMRELAKLLKEPIEFIVESKDKEQILTLPPEYIPLWKYEKDYEYRHAMKYLKDRNVTIADIYKYQIGYCKDGEYAERIIVPSFDKNGQLNYFIGRQYHTNNFPYKNPTISKNIIPFESLLSWKHLPLVIVEGVFDAIAVKRNAVPLFGKSIQSELRNSIVKNRVSDVYLVLDPDALRDSLEIAEDFLNQEINVYVVQTKGTDPAEMGFENIWKLIRQTPKLTFNDLVKLRVSLL